MIRNGLILGLVLVVVALIIVRPGPPPPKPPVIEYVNQHIFVKHTMDVEVPRDQAPPGVLEWLEKIGIKQEFVVIVRGSVKAGFDLKKDSPKISYNADRTQVQLILPTPTTFDPYVDHANSRIMAVSSTCPFFLCPQDLAGRLLMEALTDGEARLVEYARSNGILDDAAEEGRTYYETYLCSLGFEEVTVVVTGYGSSPITCRMGQD